jgi:3-hydroxyisobutyrate dehydrogenase-like beta-hydroxyacid dehydrogenase
MAEKVGFIGLGNIGNPMSRNVLKAGFSLVVYDANPAAIDRLVKEGAEPASSPKDVASRAQRICLSLPNSPIVETVCLGKDGIIEGAADGKIVIDLTSGNPPHTAQIASRLAEKDIQMIDAGVSGGVAGAEVATLGIMVGGDEKAYEACLPILRAIGQNIFHMGKIGAGHMTKALNNVLSAANYLAASEVLTVASKNGLDPAKVVAAINASSGMSFATMKRIPHFVLKGDFSFRGGMSTELIIKDVTTALGLGKEAGVPMFMAGLALQLYQLAQSIQGPLAPNQSAIKLYEEWAGVENRTK